MVTDEQAREIREYLVEELERNGFGEVAREAFVRIEEDSEEFFFEDGVFISEKIVERSERYLLNDFLTEVISVLRNLSNDNFDKLIERFNKFSGEDGKIQSILVEQINEQKPYDLKNLPSYKELVDGLKEIQLEISEGN